MKSEIIQRKRFQLDASKTAYYGGGFWEAVTIGPVEPARDRIPCQACGLPIPDPPEDACYAERLCDRCYQAVEAREGSA
jgi:hypothetical protein